MIAGFILWVWQVHNWAAHHGHPEWNRGREPLSGLLAAITYWPLAFSLYGVFYPSDTFNLLQRVGNKPVSWDYHDGGGQAPQDGGGSGVPLALPPVRRRFWLITAAPVVGLVLLSIVAVGVKIALFPEHHDSATAAPSFRPSHIPGWHTVVAARQGLTYEVPPTWSVKPATTVVGFTDDRGRRIVGGSSAAVYKEGHCRGHSGRFRAAAAVAQYPTTTDADDAVRDAAYKWARYGYPSNVGRPLPNITVAGPLYTGGYTTQATATVTLDGHNGPCSPPLAVVRAVAIDAASKVSVLIIIADRVVTDAAPDSDLQKIADSLRPST